VIIMVVSNENRSDVSNVDTSFRDSSGDTVTGVDDIVRPVYREEIGRLRAARVAAQQRSRA
jgi:hypothetical protein